MAGLFTGHEFMQDIIDQAVTEFLDRLRDRPGFSEALTAAEQEQQQRAGIRSSRPSPPDKQESQAPGDREPGPVLPKR